MSGVELRKTETFVEHDVLAGGAKVGAVEVCPERMEITRLEIFEPYRNRGYGSEVVMRLAESGYRSLWVRSDNAAAIRVYEKCGFERRGETMFEMRAKEVGA